MRNSSIQIFTTQVDKYPNCHGAIDPVPCLYGSASGEMLTGGVVQFLQGRMGLQAEEGPATHETMEKGYDSIGAF